MRLEEGGSCGSAGSFSSAPYARLQEALDSHDEAVHCTGGRARSVGEEVMTDLCFRGVGGIGGCVRNTCSCRRPRGHSGGHLMRCVLWQMSVMLRPSKGGVLCRFR